MNKTRGTDGIGFSEQNCRRILAKVDEVKMVNGIDWR